MEMHWKQDLTLSRSPNQISSSLKRLLRLAETVVNRLIVMAPMADRLDHLAEEKE
jgi:hypothetical protein